MEEQVGLISAVVELIGAIIGIIAAVGISIQFKINWISIVFIIISGILIIALIRLFKKFERIKKDTGLLNRQIAKCEQELYYSMENSYKKNNGYKTMNHIALEGLKRYVSLVANVLSIYTNKKVTVSIRFFEEEEEVNNSKLKILEFSENCDSEREYLFRDKVKSIKTVKYNTDFKNIIGEGRTESVNYFYEPDLNKLHKKLSKTSGKGYENETPNRESYYNSRIVVPISTNNSNLFYKKEKSGNDIKGFLCADSKKENTFPNNKIKKYFYIYLMETYASKLYIILNKYAYYLSNISKGVIHDEEGHRIN